MTNTHDDESKDMSNDERTDAREAASGAGAEELPLEDRIRRLEEILTRLESDELELDRSLELFEEGVSHIRSAEKMLARAQLRVEEVLADGREVPLDGEGEEE